MADADEATDRRGGAVAELVRDVRELLRLELELVKTELRGELRQARTAVVLLGSAVVLGVLGVAMMPAALAFAVGLALPLWAVFLLVGGGFLVVSGILAYAGARTIARIDPVPRRALHALQDLGDEVVPPSRRIDATV
jgi:hypothetical protein